MASERIESETEPERRAADVADVRAELYAVEALKLIPVHLVIDAAPIARMLERAFRTGFVEGVARLAVNDERGRHRRAVEVSVNECKGFPRHLVVDESPLRGAVTRAFLDGYQAGAEERRAVRRHAPARGRR